MDTIFHGEVVVRSFDGKIPSGAKKVLADKLGYKLADSETTGNHHMLEAKEGVELVEKDGVMYLKTDVEVDVFCMVKERHDNITLKPGTYTIQPAKEYDYISEEVRAVRD